MAEGRAAGSGSLCLLLLWHLVYANDKDSVCDCMDGRLTHLMGLTHPLVFLNWLYNMCKCEQGRDCQ